MDGIIPSKNQLAPGLKPEGGNWGCSSHFVGTVWQSDTEAFKFHLHQTKRGETGTHLEELFFKWVVQLTTHLVAAVFHLEMH